MLLALISSSRIQLQLSTRTRCETNTDCPVGAYCYMMFPNQRVLIKKSIKEQQQQDEIDNNTSNFKVCACIAWLGRAKT
jgi:hypothetical protein